MHEWELCLTTLSSQIEYIAHLKSHNITPYSWDECGKALSSTQYLTKHNENYLRRDSLDILYEQIMSCKQYLKQHLAEHLVKQGESGDERGYSMEERAFKEFHTMEAAVQRYMDEHQERHAEIVANVEKKKKGPGRPRLNEAFPDDGDRQFRCEWCTKRFKQKANLQAHVRIHTDERPFPCKFCEKKFRQLSALQVHTRKHTNDRPFTCKFCDKSYHQQSNLRLHQLSHTG